MISGTFRKEYPDVKFIWANAVEAFRKVLNLTKAPVPSFEIDLDEKACAQSLRWLSLGSPAILALKTHDYRYLHDNFILDGNGQWTYPFDNNSLELRSVEKIGFACNDNVGNTSVTNNRRHD